MAWTDVPSPGRWFGSAREIAVRLAPSRPEKHLIGASFYALRPQTLASSAGPPVYLTQAASGWGMESRQDPQRQAGGGMSEPAAKAGERTGRRTNVPDRRPPGRRGRTAAVLALVIVAVGLAVYLAGPRVAVDTTVTFDASRIGEDVAAHVAAREAGVPFLRPDAAREIVWADPQARARTPVALVYVHGFSASKGEIRPVPDEIARQLGANLFFTRLTGHGRDGAAMAEASVQSWIDDFAEAVEIGRRLGHRVVVVATSTGGGLATWAATQPDLSRDVAALVLVSPNYRVRGRGGALLTGPWGARLARLVWGEDRGFVPVNEAHGRLWTTRYPTRAVLPMMALTGLARNARVEAVRVPALFIYAPGDKVVDAAATARVAARWGAQADSLLIGRSGDPQNHVITGDARSPSTNAFVIGAVTGWLKGRGLGPEPR